MNIFVTGATGFIGSHFVNAALKEGHKVVAHRRSKDSKPRIELVEEPSWVTGRLDMMTKVDLAYLETCDVVIHLAAHTPNVPYGTLTECIYWNSTVPLRLFNAAHNRGVRLFIAAGSFFEYGESVRYGPSRNVRADSPLLPKTTYATSKAIASLAFAQFARDTRSEVFINRIFHTYGDGEPDCRLWPTLKRLASTGENVPMTQGGQVRDFVPVETVVAKFLDDCAFMMKNPVLGHAIAQNVGSGKEQTVREFAEHWWKEWKGSGRLIFGALPYRKDEIMRCVPDLHQCAIL